MRDGGQSHGSHSWSWRGAVWPKIKTGDKTLGTGVGGWSEWRKFTIIKNCPRWSSQRTKRLKSEVDHLWGCYCHPKIKEEDTRNGRNGLTLPALRCKHFRGTNSLHMRGLWGKCPGSIIAVWNSFFFLFIYLLLWNSFFTQLPRASSQGLLLLPIQIRSSPECKTAIPWALWPSPVHDSPGSVLPGSLLHLTYEPLKHKDCIF